MGKKQKLLPNITVIIPNYNKCSKLTFIQKIEEPLNTRVSVCLEVSFIFKIVMVILNLGLVGSSTVLAVGSPRQSDQKKKCNPPLII